MVEPTTLTARRGTTRSRQVKLHMTVWPLVDALRAIARPLAARRPADPVPPALHAQAKGLLAATRRVLSREPGMGHLFVLGETCDWATLLSQLDLAMAGFAAYRLRYSGYDSDLGEVVWHDEAWLSFRRSRDESANGDNALDET